MSQQQFTNSPVAVQTVVLSNIKKRNATGYIPSVGVINPSVDADNNPYLSIRCLTNNGLPGVPSVNIINPLVQVDAQSGAPPAFQTGVPAQLAQTAVLPAGIYQVSAWANLNTQLGGGVGTQITDCIINLSFTNAGGNTIVTPSIRQSNTLVSLAGGAVRLPTQSTNCLISLPQASSIQLFLQVDGTYSDALGLQVTEGFLQAIKVAGLPNQI